MRLTVLGAGPAYTDRPGATGASYLVSSGDTHVLLDLGQGSLPRLFAAIPPTSLTAVVISHLHPDHSGQNTLFPGIPIYVQPSEWQTAHETEYTILDWIDFPGAEYRQVAGDHEPAPGIRIFATPGHSPGHQSLVVDVPGGPILLAGQAVYSHGEWAGIDGSREGASRAMDGPAYARSVARLRALDPKRVLFGHDHRGWP